MDHETLERFIATATDEQKDEQLRAWAHALRVVGALVAEYELPVLTATASASSW